MCIRDNPEDARRMLLQNPQLAYALLQAQLVMKIIDPKVADVRTNKNNQVCCCYCCIWQAILHVPFSERQIQPQIAVVDRERPVHHQQPMPPHRPVQPPPQQPPVRVNSQCDLCVVWGVAKLSL